MHKSIFAFNSTYFTAYSCPFENMFSLSSCLISQPRSHSLILPSSSQTTDMKVFSQSSLISSGLFIFLQYYFLCLSSDATHFLFFSPKKTKSNGPIAFNCCGFYVVCWEIIATQHFCPQDRCCRYFSGSSSNRRTPRGSRKCRWSNERKWFIGGAERNPSMDFIFLLETSHSGSYIYTSIERELETYVDTQTSTRTQAPNKLWSERSGSLLAANVAVTSPVMKSALAVGQASIWKQLHGDSGWD